MNTLHISKRLLCVAALVAAMWCAGAQEAHAQYIGEDTVWSPSDGVFVIDGTAFVDQGATLTIEAGTVIKFAYGAGLQVHGRLVVEGEEGNPVVFTSLANDERGGDTNDDGSATVPERFDSWGVYIVGESPEVVMESAVFEYGSGVVLVNAEGLIQDTSFLYTTGALVLQNSHAQLRNLTIYDVWDHGILGYGSIINAEEVYITDIFADDVLSVRNSELHLSDSRIENVDGFSAMGIYDSFATLNEITLDTGMEVGISSSGSEVEIVKSRFRNFTDEAIGIYRGTHAKIEESVFESNGIGVAWYNSDGGSAHDSQFIGNLAGSEAYNNASSPDMSNNWWNDAMGPYHASDNPEGLGDAVYGSAIVSPWLSAPPGDGVPAVAFIPGFQGTRLHIPRNVVGYDRVWEPEFNADIKALYLDEYGQSINDIRVGEVIDSIKASFLDFPVKSVYARFFSFLDTQVSEGVIAGWDTLPYDWRMKQDDIVTGDIPLLSGGTYTMVERIEELAAASESGTVVLIGHSNGGLVGKMLIQELERQGKANFIEHFIMVGTPQVGTPKAIAGILHGEDQRKLAGILMKKSTALELGENMFGAHTLLPSEAYLDAVADPVIGFDDSLTTKVYRDYYGEDIDTYEELDEFLRGREGRSTPQSVREPLVLNPDILTPVQALQVELDVWQPPEGIEVTQIVGWGLPTIKGIEYYEREKMNCTLLFLDCHKSYTLDYRPMFTDGGDGTVVYQSSSYLDDGLYYFDFDRYNNDFGLSFDHLDMLEAELLHVFLGDIVLNKEIMSSDYLNKNSPDKSNKDLLFSIHSPMTIGITDSEGNYTGLVGDSIDPDSDEIRYYKEDIPGSKYVEFGEGKYILLPEDGEYEVVLEGYDNGTATLEIESDGSTVSFEHLPVQSASVGKLRVAGDVYELSYDLEGDGDFESVYEPGEVLREDVFEGGSAIVSRGSSRGEVAGESIVKSPQEQLTELVYALIALLVSAAEDGQLSDLDPKILSAIHAILSDISNFSYE